LKHINGEKELFLNKSIKRLVETYVTVIRPRLSKTTSPNNLLFTTTRGAPISRQGFWKLIKKYGEQLGLGNINPNIFRHTFAINALSEGKDLKTVASELGLANTSSAYIYKINSKKEEL